MKNFIFENPTRILFGEGMLDRLPDQIQSAGKRILLVYGMDSIRRSGLYDRLLALLEQAGKEVFELAGIAPNPRRERVAQGIEICRREKIDFILAAGGGSVIDTAKAVAAGSLYAGDYWQDLYREGKSISSALPLGVILTMPATGSEMNGITVLVDTENKIKYSYNNVLLNPRFSILEPRLTMTMPKEQVIYGTIDMMSHVFEQYFSPPDHDNLTEDLAEAILRNIRVNLDRALLDLNDYQSRSNLMWCGTMAYNGLLRNGKDGDFQAHRIEYALSGTYDIPHGAGMAIVHPNLLYHIRKKAAHKLARLAVRVFDIPALDRTEEELALAAVTAIRDYFTACGAPARLSDLGIGPEGLEEVAGKVNLIRTGYYPLEYEDVLAILRMSV
ncbi:MAG TPA: iron-containing alcohol dehydrogenase [Clostridiaceae bacterium]|nr:iron-containing alcohol dehydrogenase [Clostridiaceae bacterium]